MSHAKITLSKTSPVWLKLDSQCFDTFRQIKDLSSPAEMQCMNFLNNSTSWYIKRAGVKHGPFAYFDILRQLQEKVLYAGDLICSSDSPEWVKIADCEQFKPENIRSLLELPSVEVKNVFLKRQPRVEYFCDVVAHLNKDSFEGKSVELSSNGVGLVLESPRLYLGQNLFLFFKVSDEIPKFNAIGTIVSKINWLQNPQDVKYGIKFLNINKEVRNVIKNFTQNKSQKKAA